MADQLTPRVLDRLLPLAARRASAPGGLRVTEGQLQHELCRLLVPAHRLPRRAAFTLPIPVPEDAFRAALARHRELPGLLAPAAPRTTPPGLHTGEPDLFDYGLPRLLVCESQAIAAMLRANGLPMESACPVVSAAELPLHPGVVAMLARVRGTVYVLHGASAAGLRFPARVRELAGLAAEVRVVPLGLRPRQAMGLHLFHRHDRDDLALDRAARPDLRAAPGLSHLDPRERDWLRRGRAVDLDAVRPAALLRTVHRLVREVRPPRTPLVDLRRARDAGFLTWPAA
ncbi:hypothetical protein [Nocardia farcinica]|uniref:hypothetical protein n=1 Tax=Nocardia farcinica TaxID=37329 RepID=UPI0028056D3D|nr:hypothetical protein [Nocardia farcinica]